MRGESGPARRERLPAPRKDSRAADTRSCSRPSETATSPERALLEVEPMDAGGMWLGAARRLARIARLHRSDVVLVHSDREHLIAAIAYRIGSRARVIRRMRAGSRPLDIRGTGRIAARIAPTCYL